MYELIPIVGMLVPITFFALIGVIVWIGSRTRVKVAALQANTIARVVDKLATNPESIGFLESEAGKQLLETITTKRSNANPYNRILGAVRVGVVFTMLGLGMLLFHEATGIQHYGLPALGILLCSLGLGFMIAAWLTHRLSKSWGLLDGRRSDAAAASQSKPSV
jgi:predicted small integral membrane protein